MNSMNPKDENLSNMSISQFIKWNWIMAIRDPNAIIVIASNLLLLFLYIKNSWNGLTLLLTLIIQVLITLFFYTISILFYRDYPKNGLHLASRPNKPYSKSEMVIRGFGGVILFTFIYGAFSIPIISFSWGIFNIQPEYHELIKITVIFGLSELIRTILNINKSLVTLYKNSSLNLISGILLPFYGIVFIWIVLIPYLGVILFILFKIFIEFVFYNISNSTQYQNSMEQEFKIQ